MGAVSSFEIQKTHFSQERQDSLNSAIDLLIQKDVDEIMQQAIPRGVPGRNRGRVLREAYTEVEVLGRVELILIGTDGDLNMLSAGRVARLWEIESRIRGMEGYEEYCLRSRWNSPCAPTNSLTTFFYPSVVGGKLVYDGQGASMLDFRGL